MATFNSKQLDKIFDALGNNHRREIVYALGLQPHSISQLAAMQHLSLPAIHKHIKILDNAKLIKRKKIGRNTFLTINRPMLRTLQDWLMQYQTHWGNDKETLTNYEQYLNKKLSKGNRKSLNKVKVETFQRKVEIMSKSKGGRSVSGDPLSKAKGGEKK